MWHILDFRENLGGRLVYRYEVDPARQAQEGLTMVFRALGNWPDPFMAIDYMHKALGRSKFTWVIALPGGYQIDLDALKAAIPELAHQTWIRSLVLAAPRFEGYASDEMSITFEIARETVERPFRQTSLPAEITESLTLFRLDHPDPTNLGFIMMHFGKTPAHAAIVSAIKKALQNSNIMGLRADDRAYHEMTFPNIMTYMHGCRFGVAVFERIETDDFNPNVALEVGYMKALRKPVCLLKDETLKALQTDLGGSLYHPFDLQDLDRSISAELARWLHDYDLA